MKTFPLIISSPDGDVFKDSIIKIILRGTAGDLAVMAGHTPFITSIKPCECKIECEDGTVKIGKIEGGILSVSAETVKVISGSFIFNN